MIALMTFTFFSPDEVARLSTALDRQGGEASSFSAACVVERVDGETRFECAGPALGVSGYASPGGGAITRLAVPGHAPLSGLAVLPGDGTELRLAENSQRLPARLATGERLSPLRLAEGRAEITVTDDVAGLRRAVATLDLSANAPLRAGALASKLVAGLPR